MEGRGKSACRSWANASRTDRVAVLGAAALGGQARAPLRGLGVEPVEIGDRAPGEERPADILDGPLDAPLLVAAGDGDRPRLEAVVGGEREQRRMEADGVPAPLEHRALEVVVEQDPRTGLPGEEGRLVAAQEILHARVEEEAQEDLARPAQHHHEGHQRAQRGTDLAACRSAPSRPGACSPGSVRRRR